MVCVFSDEWEKQYLRIWTVLQNKLHSYESINHIGSTSIKGMIAKPIIDIDITYRNYDDFLKLKIELESIGYVHNGNQGIEGREVFKRNGKKYNKVLDSIEHHLYVCHVDNEEYKRHILFRDYLQVHAEKVKQYCGIKIEIMSKYGIDNREKYVEVKESEYKWFFDEVIRLAKLEKEE